MQSTRSILEILTGWAESHPAKAAFLARPDDGVEIAWTYRELLDRSLSTAGSLREIASPGERVLLLLPGGLSFLQAFFGCLFAGCVPVPLPPVQHRRHLDRIRRVQRDCLASFAIVAERRDLVPEGAEDMGVRGVTLDALEGGVPADPRAFDPSDIAFLQYTSGSTGDPKGAIVTHRGILANQRAIKSCFGHDARSVVVGWLPLFHDMGLIGNILQPIYCGIPCILLPTTRVLQNPVLWLQAISDHRATTSGGPDFMYSLCARRVRPEDRQSLDLSSWKVAFNGSEPIRAETLTDFADAFRECGFRDTAFLPCYGLAEATLLVTGQPVGSGTRVAWADRHDLERGVFRAGPETRPDSAPFVSCGPTWGDTRVAIVDPESGHVLPDGSLGEVLIEGETVVPGYWGGRNSSSTIVELPGGVRRLRTGDLGFVDRGDLFLVGRLKDTLVIRGRNVYSADVESAAQCAHARLEGRRAAVFALPESSGESIVLVHEAARAEAREGEEICRALNARLAEEFGVTADVILLTRPGMIPVTTSGKVQRTACRQRVAAGELPVWHEWRKTVDESELTDALVAAMCDPDVLPRLLAQLPAGVDLSTTLVSLGLDSVQTLRLGHEIETRTGVRLDWASLTSATLDDLVRGALGRARATALDVAPVAPELEGEQPVPLSPGQLALWYLHLLAPKNRYWHLARSLEFEGPVDRHALDQTVRLLVTRHPSLRARVAHEDGAWVQTYLPTNTRNWTIDVDASAVGERDVVRAANAAAARPFAPETGGLFRTVCFAGPAFLPPTAERRPPVPDGPPPTAYRPVVQLAIHHLAADLWSIGILLREFLETYERFRAGLPPHLPPVRGRYATFARQQSRLTQSADGESQAYWQSILDGGESAAPLGLEQTGESTNDLRVGGLTFAVPRDVAAKVRQLARAEGRTAFAVLLSAFEALAGRLSGEPRSLIGTVLSGRADAGLSAVVGYFARAVPMRVDLSSDPSFRALVTRVSDDVRGALPHQSWPIELLGGRRSATGQAHAPFDIVFVYQGAAAGLPSLTASLAVGVTGDVEQIGTLRVRPLASSHAVPQFPLVFTVTERGEEFLVHVSHRVTRYSAGTAAWLGKHFVALLQDGVDRPDVRVSHLDCWPAAAQAAERTDIVAWPAGATLHGEFRTIAAAMPDRVATGSAEQQLTYGQLDRESDRLADRLPTGEEVIGIYLRHGATTAVAVLGVLKSGTAYLPLTTTWPTAYVAHVLGGAGVRAVVTSREDEAGLPDDVRRIYVEDPPEPHGRRRDVVATDRSIAYLIYTSGSTGDPKAVSVSHGHVLRLLSAARHVFDFDRNDVWTLFHAISFDFSVWEIWGAWLHGGRLEVPSREVCRDPAAFHDLLVSRQVTVLNQTPTAFAALQPHLVDAGRGAIRDVIFGGEKLDFRLLAPSFAGEGDRPRFVNMYGITETTVHVTVHRVARPEVIDGRTSCIGQPLADLQTHVLSASMRPVPVGGVGEIYVGGAGVANGYWRRPEATAERFLPDPFTTVAGSRLYRTGDMARRLEDGSLAFLGRRDTQVKVRGHRIELGAIESVLLRHTDIRQAVVLFERPPARRNVLQLEPRRHDGHEREAAAVDAPVREFLPRVELEAADTGQVCAFVVRDRSASAGVSALRRFASQWLPDYMLPSRWVFLDALPRTVNGKVDTRALRSMIAERPELDEDFVAPSTPIEASLAETWSSALGVGRVGIDDNLFELGGDSIRSIRIVGLAQERGLRFSLAQLLESPTIRALAAVVAANQGTVGDRATERAATAAEAPAADATTEAAAAAALPDGVEDAYPLTRLQEGILYHCALDPDPTLYRDVFLYHFRMPLDPRSLRESLRQVTLRHAALRTAFDLDGFAEPMQLVHRDAPIDFQVIRDWQQGDADRSRALLQWAEAERHRTLSMNRLPPVRYFALEDGRDSFHLALSFHDALLDGWSASLLLGEIMQRYQHALAGHPIPVEPLPRVSFRDFVLAERDELRRADARDFWRHTLDGFDPCLVGGSDARRGLAVVKVPVSAERSAELIAVANRLKVPLKSVLLAVHLRVLASWLGKGRVVTGLESNGRLEAAGADEPLGLHLNTLPFACDLGRGTWADLVRAAFARERAIWPFRRFPLAEIKKGSARRDIFDSVFNYTHFHHLRRLESLRDLSVLGARGLGSTHFSLRAEFNRDPFRDLVQLDLEMDTGKFSAAEREALAAAYGEALRALTAGGNAQQSHHLFAPRWGADDVGISGPSLPAVANVSVRDRFDELVRRQPDAVALTFEQGCLTYRGLDRAASTLAHTLRGMGVRRGERIGICVQDPVDAIAAMIAGLKLACPYVPLDPRAPLDRTRAILDEARPGCLVASRDLGLEALAGKCTSGVLTLAPGLLRVADDQPFDSEPARLDDQVYVIFTSGSTGSPKGVPVTNRNLWASLEARARQYPESPEGFLLLSPLFFDSSVAGVFGTLYRGGTIVVPPADVPREPGSIADWISRRQVTHLLALPRVHAALLDAAAPQSLASLRRVIVAGEACQPAHVLRHFRMLPEVDLTNEYGPTESTVWSTAFDCLQYRGQTTVPIGRPIAGITVRLLGAGMEPVRPGGEGEIYLSGPAVVSGYLGRPELTARSFVPDPFSSEPGARLYRTGDRARLLPRGDLEFRGRTDRQLKIRGHRVEPAEIEAVLASCPGIAEACVSIDAATRQLIAFVTPRGGACLDPGDVRQYAARSLPEHMRPKRVHVVAAMPRTSSGKIDLARLAPAESAADAVGEAV